MTHILVVADSLSGTGHQRRAELLCGALLDRGYTVTYFSHALYQPRLRERGTFQFVEWPSYAGNLDDPRRLLAVKRERLRQIAQLHGQVEPASVLLCEHFPIGKLYVQEEVAQLRKQLCRASARQICVHRDIIDDGDMAQADKALACLNRDFQGLFVFSDERVQPLPPAFSAQVQIPITYLGYLDPHERRTIVVFGGGGKLNDVFYARTLGVLRDLAPRYDCAARMYTGSLIGEEAFAALQAHAGLAVTVARSSGDLDRELAQAIVTISTLGYNTFLELLHLNQTNVIVPLAHNDEQMTRARLLAQLKPDVAILELDDHFEAALGAVLERTLHTKLNTGGLRTFQAALEALCLPA